MTATRKQRFVVELDDDAFRKVRILRAVTGMKNQEILSEGIRLVAERYKKEFADALSSSGVKK